jgi:16S rRNA processing protein RimM
LLIELKGQLVPAKACGCKFFKNMVILKFEGFDNMNDVEKLRQCKILVDRENAVKLEKDEYFVADLLDMTVVDEDGNDIGKITDVMETGANDVYVIGMNDGREKLIPAIKDCILDVDMENGIMKVHLLKEMDD